MYTVPSAPSLSPAIILLATLKSSVSCDSDLKQIENKYDICYIVLQLVLYIILTVREQTKYHRVVFLMEVNIGI